MPIGVHFDESFQLPLTGFVHVNWAFTEGVSPSPAAGARPATNARRIARDITRLLVTIDTAPLSGGGIKPHTPGIRASGRRQPARHSDAIRPILKPKSISRAQLLAAAATTPESSAPAARGI
jgi:hypothetical protein